jgi:hypothetical protein
VSSDRFSWSWAGVALLGLVAASLAGLALAGFLNGNHLAPVLTFVGTSLTVAVTFVGLVAKDLGDRRIAQEAKRDAKRLEADSAMKAVGMLSTANGKAAHPATAGGALLALASLGQTQLAVSLLFDLWQDEKISSSVAVLLVEQALKSDSAQAQTDAAVALSENLPRLVTIDDDGEKAYDWPYDFDCNWATSPPEQEARGVLLAALVYMWTDATTGFELEYRRQQFLASLYAVFLKETDQDLRACASRLILAILRRRPRPPVTAAIAHTKVTISTGLREELKAACGDGPMPSDLQALDDQVKAWLEGRQWSRPTASRSRQSKGVVRSSPRGVPVAKQTRGRSGTAKGGSG